MKIRASILTVLCTAGIAAGAGAEGVPEVLWYAGTITDTENAPLEGVHQVTFELFLQATGGDALCRATDRVELQHGYFRLDVADCAETIASHATLHVGLSLNDRATVFPRLALGSVPYALEAKRAVTASAVARDHASARHQRLCTGSTSPADWELYPSEVCAFVVAFDTSNCRFTRSARYFTTLVGDGNSWKAVGGSNPYIALAPSIRVHVHVPGCGDEFTLDYIRDRNWRIDWMVVGD